MALQDYLLDMQKILLSLTLLLSVYGAFAQTDTTANPTDSLQFDNSLIPTLSGSDLEGEEQEQEVSGLLNSSTDIFTNIASYNFGNARFRVRGYNGDNFIVMMNGVRMNDPELGFAIWANWGGLNDITRYPESRSGISENPYEFGGIGGYSNINIQASSKRKGTRISHSFTNRAYRNRTMITYNTGKMANGWSVSSSISGRWADEGYVEGTYYSNMAYFLSVEKQINANHRFGFTGFGSPSVRGRNGITVQEVYDLTGNNFYNPYWGWQGDKKRNSRVRSSHKPLFFLWDEYKINDKTTVFTNLYGQTGKYGQTRLNWFNAPDPRPDYYRNLPSYIATRNNPLISAEEAALLWKYDEHYSQIDWDGMYFANSKNLATIQNVDGEAGKNYTGFRSKYILEEAHSDPRMLGINARVSNKFTDKITLTGGINAYKYKSQNYKVIDDLLGGEFWVDIDQFALRDFADEDAAQSDLNHPNRIVKEGDRFGYDYDIHKNVVDLFGQVEITQPKYDVYAAINLNNTKFWRDGKMKKGLFPEDSYGESEKKSFLTGGVKFGLLYKITGRHFLRADVQRMNRAPGTRNSFLSARTRNEFVKDLSPEQITSGQLSYIIRYPNLKLRLTGYLTNINNQVWSRSFYHDELRSFVNYAMTGVDQRNLGMELGVEGNLTSTLTATGALALGEYYYTSRPIATITTDNSSEVIDEGRTVYLKNYYVGGMPQQAANVGLRYRAPKYWWAGINFNAYGDTWLSPNPDRRTEEAVAPFVTTDPQWKEVLGQKELDPGTSLDLSFGKSWRFQHKYYLLLVLNINNALDNTDYITGGYEQLRYDSNDIDKFANKYGYMYGRSYYAMVRFSF